jgi:hypothetical protein
MRRRAMSDIGVAPRSPRTGLQQLPPLQIGPQPSVPVDQRASPEHTGMCPAQLSGEFRMLGSGAESGRGISMQKIMALGCAAAVVLAATSSQVVAQSVCYRVGEDDGDVLRVYVRQNAILTTGKERREFGADHPIQRVYLVNGRSLQSTDEGFIKGTINGTVILGQGIGAQMSLTDLQHHDFAGFQGHLSHCESGENAISSTPDEWFARAWSWFLPSLQGKAFLD